MAAIIKSKIPSLESFEETYKTAYSHGLEAIYSLETVDIKTVKKIELYSPDPENAFQKENTLQGISSERDFQIEMDFGEEFSESVTPYFLDEPIKVLSLSLQAENFLIAHGLKKIHDLISHGFQEAVSMKGMGQGHIDEVKKKLQNFLGGRSLKKTNIVDFRSLLLGISSDIPFKKMALFLKDYHLESCVPLTLSEKTELKAFDSSKNPVWKKDVSEAFSEAFLKAQIFDHLEKIAKVFVIPWMESRGGIASLEEITERLERISLQPLKASCFLKFFSENFTNHQFLLSPFLNQCEKELFVANEQVFLAYQMIIEEARSYFYNNEIYYPFDQLKFLLQRAFVKRWENHSVEFLSECLKRSSHFRVSRGSSGYLEIRLR